MSGLITQQKLKTLKDNRPMPEAKISPIIPYDKQRMIECFNACAGIPDDELGRVISQGLKAKALGYFFYNCNIPELKDGWLKEALKRYETR